MKTARPSVVLQRFEMNRSLAARVLGRYLRAKSAPDRKPIEVTKGYHITSESFAKSMLDKGVSPKSKGNLGGEFARDKTYFFRDLSSAVESALDRMREAGEPLTFDTAEKLKHAVVEFDLTELPTYADPEMPEEAGFTTKKIPSSAVKKVDFKEWEPIITRYGKKHKLPVKLPGGKSKEPETNKSKFTPDAAPKKPVKPTPKESPKSESNTPDSKEAFLDEVGDQKVPNPNPESRARFPHVKIRSLEWEHQKPFYEKWKA